MMPPIRAWECLSFNCSRRDIVFVATRERKLQGLSQEYMDGRKYVHCATLWRERVNGIIHWMGTCTNRWWKESGSIVDSQFKHVQRQISFENVSEDTIFRLKSLCGHTLCCLFTKDIITFKYQLASNLISTKIYIGKNILFTSCNWNFRQFKVAAKLPTETYII